MRVETPVENGADRNPCQKLYCVKEIKKNEIKES